MHVLACRLEGGLILTTQIMLTTAQLEAIIPRVITASERYGVVTLGSSKGEESRSMFVMGW
jgi:hypothetical protein